MDVSSILKSLEEPERRTEPVDTKDILVWWDIETCSISLPTRGSSHAATCLLQDLQRHVTCDEICVTINVYGNGGTCSKAALDALITSGITLQHRILPCKQPGKISTDKKPHEILASEELVHSIFSCRILKNISLVES